MGIDNEKYLNHSDDPTVNEEGYALKNIAIGDEITIDYNNFDDNIKLNNLYPNPPIPLGQV